MKKRVASIFITGALVSAALTGCGTSQAPALTGDAEEETTASEDTVEEAKTEEGMAADLDYDG